MGIAKTPTTPAASGCWVLTSEVNDYDQHGEYFCAAWADKPTVEQLADYFATTNSGPEGDIMEIVAYLLHITNGGGRRKAEHEWWNLRYVEFQTDKKG